MKYTKQLFVHRIAGTALFGLSPVFVYAYTSLAIVVVWKPYFLFSKDSKCLCGNIGGQSFCYYC